jgi:DNA-binding MarR family transcriptional regulator
MVMLTPEGKKVIDTLMVIRKQEIEKLLQVLTHEEVDLFLGAIENVAQLLSKARSNSEER